MEKLISLSLINPEAVSILVFLIRLMRFFPGKPKTIEHIRRQLDVSIHLRVYRGHVETTGRGEGEGGDEGEVEDDEAEVGVEVEVEDAARTKSSRLKTRLRKKHKTLAIILIQC